MVSWLQFFRLLLVCLSLLHKLASEFLHTEMKIVPLDEAIKVSQARLKSMGAGASTASTASTASAAFHPLQCFVEYQIGVLV